MWWTVSLFIGNLEFEVSVFPRQSSTLLDVYTDLDLAYDQSCFWSGHITHAPDPEGVVDFVHWILRAVYTDPDALEAALACRVHHVPRRYVVLLGAHNDLKTQNKE